MRSLLPWIGYGTRDRVIQEEKGGKSLSKLTLPPSELKPFQLKSLSKHVSDYEKSEASPNLQEATSTHQFFYKSKENGSALSGAKLIREQEIMEKAFQVNNKYYVPLMRSMKLGQKSALKGSLSLQRFRISQKENKLSRLDPSKQVNSSSTSQLLLHVKHESDGSIKDALRPFKVSRQFRSKWFTELQAKSSI